MCPASFFLFARIFFAAPLFVGMFFENPQIRPNGDILFSVSHNGAGEIRYSSLALTRAGASGETERPSLLTCFPEKIEPIQGGEAIQIRNRYGTARYSFSANKMSPVTLNGTIPQGARLPPMAVSPDGKWACFVKKTSAARGPLVVRNLSEGAGQNDIVLVPNMDFSYGEVPARWSPDGAVLVYERAGNVLFLRASDIERNTILEERYRTIGAGLVSSVSWASEKNLVYIHKDVIYAIPSRELYTRSIYGSFIGIGSVIGKLSWNFDAASDSFWANPSLSALILMRDKNIVFGIDLAEKKADEGFASVLSGFTSAVVPQNVTGAKVFWDSSEKPVVWFESASGGALYKLNGASFIKIYGGDFVGPPAASPDLKNLAFVSGGEAVVFSLEWNAVNARLSGDGALSLAWKANDRLVVGGESTIRLWNIDTKTAETLYFSSAPREYGWDEVSGKICVKTSEGSFVYEDGRWTRLTYDAPVAAAELSNGYNRVFTGESPNKNFDNALYIRTLTGAMETRALLPDSAVRTAYKGKVALVFDALDDASGVGEILRALSAYGIRTTFFVNGEFIRRFPLRLKEIIDSGHSCASMFFTAADLSAEGYRIDGDFIRRGLARNEDEFLAATGKELSLLWHTPGYVVNDTIKKAGAEAGYTWVNKGLAPPDRVTLEIAGARHVPYYSASDMIETMYRVLSSPGAPRSAVIPVSVGVAGGTRGDYLYEKLDLLISVILDAGYEIVSADRL
jgi:peptidoglycan/xylan/chitin deacetylase (PgdA/CDA1 family)/WD40 repeat protein